MQVDGEDFVIVNLTHVGMTAVDIYETVVALRPRLQIVVALVNLVPGLERKLVDSRGNRFNLDIQAIEAAFDLLEPKGSDMLSDEARTEWSSKITTLSTYVKQIEGLLKTESLSEQDKELMSAARKKSHRAEICNLYFDHVLQSDVDLQVREIVCNNLRLLWIGLKDLDFASGPQTFKKVLKAIESCCRKAGESYLDFKGVQECIVCLESIRDPVILPCSHVGCKKCLEDYFRSSKNRTCPKTGCKQIVSENFVFRCADNLKMAVDEHAKFRKKLSQFFLDLLQRFVFEQALPHQDIVETLLSFIVTKSLPNDNKKPRTKELSPFPGDYIDSRPVIRSFVLQLLFRYDFQTVEVHLQRYIDEKEQIFESGSQFPELCVMIVQCLEDSFMAKDRKASRGKNPQIAAMKYMKSQLENNEEEVNLVGSLLKTAQDRIAINKVAEMINNFLSGDVNVDSIADLMKIAVDFVKLHRQSANIQKYLVRYIASKFQLNAIVEWKKRGVFLDLLPEDLRNTADNAVPDMYLTVDRNYKLVRDALVRAWLGGEDFRELTTVINRTRENPKIWALAFHQLTKVNPCRMKDPDAFEAFLNDQKLLSDIWKKSSEDLFPSLTGRTHRHDSIFNLMIHFREILKDAKMSQFLDIFKQLAKNPKNCGQTYLPTMPQDETLEAKEAVKDATTWYSCPNGHAYAIGNCGQPVEAGRCPSCKVDVGGARYAFAGTGLNVQQVQQAGLIDATKPGHILGPSDGEARSTTVREISGLEVALIRFFIHSAMMEGCQSNPQDVLALIDPRIPDGSEEEFVANHLLLNLRQISECLGKSENDVIVFLHQIIEGFGKINYEQGDWKLSTKASVRTWENSFVKSFVQPVLQKLETDIARQRLAVQEDKEEATSVLQEILMERNETTNDRSKILSLTQFWSPRDNVTVERIESKVGGAERLKQRCPLLAHLLKEEMFIAELAHLPQLLELGRFMVGNYNRKLEASETDKMSIKQFLLQEMDISDRKYVRPLVDVYLTVLSKLKINLFTFNW